jgi:hypothetical protein
MRHLRFWLCCSLVAACEIPLKIAESPTDTSSTDDGGEGSEGQGNDGSAADGGGSGEEGGGDAAVDSAPETGLGDPATRDRDGDGLLDVEEGWEEGTEGQDTDRDGTPDHLDLDSDNDGINDADEAVREDSGGFLDTDGDGLADHLDPDSDGDTLPDLVEGSPGAPDWDGDGLDDFRDTDADNDSLPDRVEGDADWDGDGIPNFRDPRNDGVIPPLNFTAISTAFNSPIGIDYHESTGTVVMSVNYPSGSPYVLETVLADGSHRSFSGYGGLTDEVKIATARSGNPAGFATGELFVGNGLDGEIVRVDPSGTSVINPWVTLPGTSNGLMRGSLYVDRTGEWGGDLVVVTTLGQVWRVNSSGTPVLVASLPGVHLEGLVTVPNSPSRYGPIAGRILAGAEGEGLLYAFAADGSYLALNLGVLVEDIDIINPGENFFGVNFGSSRLIGVSGSEWAPMAGDILLTQESVSRVGLYILRYNGSSLEVTELTAAPGSASIAQWEHVTFANAGIQEVP